MRYPERELPTFMAEGARRYDRWFDEPWGRLAFGIESRALLSAMGFIKGAVVLDAGCGSGRFTSLLAERAALAVGVDADPDMLRIALARHLASLVLGDVHELPFPSECFDAVVAVTVCEFSRHPQRVVDELARVTRHRGRIVLGALNPRSAWGLAHRGRFREPPWNAARFLSAPELRSLGARHGRTSVTSALYAPGAFPGLDLVAPMLETLRWVAPWFGAFRVVQISRE
jgi:ubiquinone/menaquinone biosynthesis C-methylase UbiE